jgi:hypothetical protein
MFLGSTNEKATLYITGWRSVYGKPTLRYQHVVYQNLAEDCHDLARTQGGRMRSSRSTSSDILSHRLLPRGCSWWSSEGFQVNDTAAVMRTAKRRELIPDVLYVERVLPPRIFLPGAVYIRRGHGPEADATLLPAVEQIQGGRCVKACDQ